MLQHQIVIVLLLISQAVTLCLLWAAVRHGNAWQATWNLTAQELLYWKRNAVLRDPVTGKYVRKVRP